MNATNESLCHATRIVIIASDMHFFNQAPGKLLCDPSMYKQNSARACPSNPMLHSILNSYKAWCEDFLYGGYDGQGTCCDKDETVRSAPKFENAFYAYAAAASNSH